MNIITVLRGCEPQSKSIGSADAFFMRIFLLSGSKTSVLVVYFPTQN